ncbi:MAG: hypothetical protein WC663_01465 [Patescibacteria group bacterium]|jgi:hypothetical protein
MPEKPQIELQDIQQNPEQKSETGLEIVKTPESEQFVEHVNEIHEAVQRDRKVTYGQVADLRKDLEGFKLDVCGEQMTLAEIREIPDFGYNYEIWKSIMEGNIFLHNQVTGLIPNVTRKLVDENNKKNEKISNQDDWKALYFDSLKKISPKIAKEFRSLKSGIYLSTFTELSDEVIFELSHSASLFISLSHLVSLSDQQAEYLSQFQGRLNLNGVNSLSDNAARFIGQRGSYTWLDSLVHISDNGLKFLGKGRIDLSPELGKRLKKLKAEQNA